MSKPKRPKPDEELDYFRLVWPKSGKCRDWESRWNVAVEAVKGKGVLKGDMRARGDSPIWTYLATAFPDSTGNKIPPFTINSGMALKNKFGHIYYLPDGDRKNEEEEEQEEAELDFDDMTEVVTDAMKEVLEDIKLSFSAIWSIE